MASIKRRALKNGKIGYQVRWIDPDGEEQSRQFSHATTPTPAEDAKTFKIEVEAELSRGTYIDPKAGRITFREFAETWQTNQRHRTNTAYGIDVHLRVHINPVIGHRRIASLRRSDIQGVVRAVEDKGLAARTVGAVYTTLASVLLAAVWDKVIAETPAKRIPLPPIEDEPIVIPTAGQILAIASDEKLPHTARALVLMAATTGLRQGELCGLDKTEVDFLGRGRHLRVRRQLVCPNNAGRPFIGPPKSRLSRRDVPLADAASRALARHLERFPPREQRVPTRDELDRGVPPEKWSTWSLIFTNKNGTPLRRNRLNDMLRPVLARHGFEAGTGLHVFRHFYASAQIADGRSVKAVATWMGHDWTETLRTYAHLWPDDESRARDAIDAAFAAAEDADADAADDADAEAMSEVHVRSIETV